MICPKAMLAFLALSATLSMAAPAPAQPLSPSSLNAYAARTNLSESDRNAIQAYATEWAGQLGQGTDAEAIRRAQRRLLDPITLPGVSEVFRDEYSRALVNPLNDAAKSPDPLRAVNAMIVLGQLRTDRALDALLEHCDAGDEKRVYVRQAAALSIRSLLARGLASSNPRRVTAATRRLRDAAADEPEMLVLERQLTAIAAADNSRLDAEARLQVRTNLIEALEAASGRAARDGNAEEAIRVLIAMQPAVAVLRNTYINLQDLEVQRALGRDLAPAFRAILEVPATKWQALRGQPNDALDRCATVIAVTEAFLRFSDRIVRSGGSQPKEGALRDAWKNEQFDEYRRVLDEWQTVLKAPPYR